MTHWRIALSDVDLGPEEEAAVVRVVRSGWLTLGEEVSAFEQEFAQLCGIEEAVAVSSCTAALHLACVALGVGPGSEVVVPTLTFVATASAVVLAGGRPVFADSIGPDDFTLDPDDIEHRITPATRGIICVHYGGYACRLDALLDICARHNLFLIEDVAHAPAATWEGKVLGTIGDVGCFSFFGNKNLTTGEGGMAVAKDPRIRQRIRRLRSHGMATPSWDRSRGHAFDYDVVEAGYNYRPAELPAAVGREQLGKLHANNGRRNALLAHYRTRLALIRGIQMPFAGRPGVAHLAVAVLDDSSRRDGLREALRKEGIQTSLHYPPIHLFEHYRKATGHREGDFPVAEALAARAITLPLYATMTLREVDDVCACVASFLARAEEADASHNVRVASGQQYE
jgi:dTDP-4-amino-4,6-dideoxygalactose transaminase